VGSGAQRTGAQSAAPVLVTGGAGFIGSHVVRELLGAGRSVRVLDDFSTGHRENLSGAEALAAANGATFQVMEGDVRDDLKVLDAIEGCSAVVHLAAIASVSRSVEDPEGTTAVTYGGTVATVRCAVDAAVPRVVLASSCAVYGDPAELPVAETTATNPLSPYAAAKLASEEVCTRAGDAGQLTTVCLRFFNVYGPRQDPSSEYSGVISRFMDAAAAGSPVTIYGDGLQTRDFVYVGDIARAIALSLSRPVRGAAVMNLGSGARTGVLELVDHLESLGGRRIERRHAPARTGDIRDSLADPRRAAWILDWHPTTDLGTGLELTWRWYCKRRDGERSRV
jgi:UDP-glucose 4-epimerase